MHENGSGTTVTTIRELVMSKESHDPDMLSPLQVSLRNFPAKGFQGRGKGTEIDDLLAMFVAFRPSGMDTLVYRLLWEVPEAVTLPISSIPPLILLNAYKDSQIRSKNCTTINFFQVSILMHKHECIVSNAKKRPQGHTQGCA